MIELQPIVSAVIVIGIELALVALLCGIGYRLMVLTVLRSTLNRSGKVADWSNVARLKARNLLLGLSFATTVAILIYNGWLLARDVDVAQHTMALLRSITRWTVIGTALAKWTLAVLGALVITRIVRRLIRITERTINRWDQLKDNDQSLAALFGALDRAVVNVGWMLVAVFTCSLVSVPQGLSDGLVLAVRIYVVFAIGLIAVRSTTVIIATFDGLSRRYAQNRGWLQQYDHLRPLLPTLRACLACALWIGLGSLVVVQLPPMRNLAVWGPRLIQAIAIFFASRVIIELGYLELSRRMQPSEGCEEAVLRRRATVVPLVRTAFTYAVYFGAAVLMLSSLGFNPMPFLAGAGILGLVVGFGAQALVNDVVSGFFMLFENTYLVGETIQVGTPDLGMAKGVVEAIDFRTTKIRDEEGRLHVIRNGDMKPIVNYSRDYAVAVVDVTVGYDADLRAVFNALREAGDGLRASNADVLADTEIEGVVAFHVSTMIVRTLTRVRPGRGDTVAVELRLLIKETFDRQAGGVPRRTLVPKTIPMSTESRKTRRLRALES